MLQQLNERQPVQERLHYLVVVLVRRIFNRAEKVSFGAIRFRFGAISFDFGAISIRLIFSNFLAGMNISVIFF